jgi:hypothetical protein
MCMSVSPGIPVRFSNTVLYAAEIIDPNGELVHVLGYQNKVQNGVGPRSWIGRLFSRQLTGNAMILAFPAIPKSMTDENILVTRQYPHILQDMAKALTPKPRSLGRSLGVNSFCQGIPPVVQIFESGIYTVVLAQDPKAIPEALHQVPEAKRPSLNPELFDAYARWYPDWTIALCCFNTREEKLGDPLLWWYKPMNPDVLFLPGLDGHTGDLPDLNATVDIDHTIAVGSHQMKRGIPIYYQDELSNTIQPYLLDQLIGTQLLSRMPNGDFYCEVNDVRKGAFNLIRKAPIAA